METVHYHLDGITREECPRCARGETYVLDVPRVAVGAAGAGIDADGYCRICRCKHNVPAIAHEHGSVAVYVAGIAALVIVPALIFVRETFEIIGGALS